METPPLVHIKNKRPIQGTGANMKLVAINQDKRIFLASTTIEEALQEKPTGFILYEELAENYYILAHLGGVE